MPEVKSRSSPKGKKLRKLRKYLFHYILLAAFCLAIVFVMCYTVFFKLDKIQVTGCSVYSEQQIIDEIGAEEGESLFRINISNAEKTLRGKLPYIRSVKISRQFPTTLKVEIEEEEVLGAVYTLEGFTLLSTTGKVLETGVLALPESTPRIVGLPAGLVYSTGSYLREEVGSEALMEELQALKIVYEELNANGFTDITYYDVSDTLNIEVMIEDRLLLMLGSENDMAYKVGFIRKVLDAKESGDEEFENVPEEGTLDFSNPPALHTMSISVDKIKNEDAYLDFGANLPQQSDNTAGGQQSEPLQAPATEQTEGEEQAQQDSTAGQTGQDQGQTDETSPETAGAAETPEQAQQEPSQTQQTQGAGEETVQPETAVGTQQAAPSQYGAGMNESPAALGGQAVAEPQAQTQQQAEGEEQAADDGDQTGQSSPSGAYNAPSRAPIVNE